MFSYFKKVGNLGGLIGNEDEREKVSKIEEFKPK